MRNDQISALAKPISDRFKLDELIDGLAQDLRDLRDGKISNRDAQSRAVLAKQILRGIHYIVTAQKMLEARAAELPAE